MRCLYILEVNPLLMHYLQIFSPFSRLSVLLMVSFAMQKLLNLIRSHLFIFAFISFALGARFPPKIQPQFMSEYSVYILLSFMFSCLIFSSLIHYEFIFYMVGGNALISFFYM